MYQRFGEGLDSGLEIKIKIAKDLLPAIGFFMNKKFMKNITTKIVTVFTNFLTEIRYVLLILNYCAKLNETASYKCILYQCKVWSNNLKLYTRSYLLEMLHIKF